MRRDTSGFGGHSSAASAWAQALPSIAPSRRAAALLLAMVVTSGLALVAPSARAQAPDGTSEEVSGVPSPEAAGEAAAERGPNAAWMTYQNRRRIGQGRGAYEGYTDSLDAAGRYEVTPSEGSLEIAARYDWIYRGERCEDGTVERRVQVSLPDRLYVGQTDLDDYDDEPGGPFATWLWVPPGLEIGDTIRILDREFRVEDFLPPSGDAELSQSAPVHLRARGEGRRDDEYGHFRTTFVDDYWFDRESGYFLVSRYHEEDEGTYEGEPAGFVLDELVRVDTASYLVLPIGAPSSVERCDDGGSFSLGGAGGSSSRGARQEVLFFTFGFVLVVFAVLTLVTYLNRRRHASRMIDGASATAKFIARLAELPELPPKLSPHLQPFLRHFVEVALHAGEKVAVCVTYDGRCVGLAIDDKEGRVVSMFAKDGDACELLRNKLNAAEMFTEHRHQSIPSVARAAAARGASSVPSAYNELETYEIVELASPQIVAYDASVVRPMTREDLPQVEALSKEVYGVSGAAGYAALLATGELGFVAHIDGAVVGFGFATVAKGVGRMHGNTVSPAHRGRGLGKELALARVAGCVGLGATRIIAEVATWNVGSLEVLRGLGFTSVGTLWVETSRNEPLPGRTVRR